VTDEDLALIDKSQCVAEGSDRPSRAAGLPRAPAVRKTVAVRVDSNRWVGAVADLVDEASKGAEPDGVDQEIDLSFSCSLVHNEVVERGSKRLGVVQNAGARGKDEFSELLV
jgi:hypothetical protein